MWSTVSTRISESEIWFRGRNGRHAAEWLHVVPRVGQWVMRVESNTPANRVDERQMAKTRTYLRPASTAVIIVALRLLIHSLARSTIMPLTPDDQLSLLFDSKLIPQNVKADLPSDLHVR